MVAAVPSVDVVEDLVSLLWRHTILEYTRDSAFVELIVDDGELLRALDDFFEPPLLMRTSHLLYTRCTYSGAHTRTYHSSLCQTT
jgi:hypothetical protein